MTAKNPITRITCYSTNDSAEIKTAIKRVAAEIGVPYDLNINPPLIAVRTTYQILLSTSKDDSVRDIAEAVLNCRKAFAVLCEETAHIRVHIVDSNARKNDAAVLVDPTLSTVDLAQQIFDSRQGWLDAFDSPANALAPTEPADTVVAFEPRKLKVA